MLKAELKVTGGTHAGKVIPLARQRFLIGRGDDCQLRPASEQISRHHCVFSIDAYTVRLRDLGSTNGTFVNNERLHGEVILKPGDAVRLGALDFVIEIFDKQTYDESAAGKGAGSLLPVQSLLTDLSADTAELAAADTALDLRPAPAEISTGDADAAVKTTVAPASAQPQQYQETVALPPPPQLQPQMPQQPYPPQPMPMGMPYPPQPGYHYPPQGMPYPQQAYPYPGYMPMPGQYMPQPGYPPAGAYPSAAPVPAATETEPAEEMLVRLPPPETTGAQPPAPKPDGEGGQKAADPSTMAADIIKNMRNRRPPGLND